MYILSSDEISKFVNKSIFHDDDDDFKKANILMNNHSVDDGSTSVPVIAYISSNSERHSGKSKLKYHLQNKLAFRTDLSILEMESHSIGFNMKLRRVRCLSDARKIYLQSYLTMG